MPASVAVMDLVQEPMWKTSLVVMGVGSPVFRAPTATRSHTTPSFTTTTARAGRLYFLRMVSMAWGGSSDAGGGPDDRVDGPVAAKVMAIAMAETTRMLN